MWTKIRSTIWEIVKFVAITLVIVLPIRTFVAQPFIVSGSSMHPTFESNQYLVIDELSYYFREPIRGEVIVFKYPKDPAKHFIKRIIGLPGETVKITNGEVLITTVGNKPEQIKLAEPYVQENLAVANLEVKLLNNEYFVLGDNRPVSLDSRIWGPLPRNLITGRVFLRLLPPSTLAYLPGQPAQAK
ncbi:MAG: signal peptidase I [Patescibacteria group bacterium]